MGRRRKRIEARRGWIGDRDRKKSETGWKKKKKKGG